MGDAANHLSDAQSLAKPLRSLRQRPIYCRHAWLARCRRREHCDFRLLNIAVAAVALALCVVAFRRLPASYSLSILLGALLLFSPDGSHMHALARYVGALFAVFVALAAWSLPQRWTPSGGVISEPVSPVRLELRDRVVLLPRLLMLAVFTLMFTAGVWAAM
jgi:hypothetical protein